MANVTFDAVGVGANGTNVTSLSWSHTSGGVNRAISVGVASADTTTANVQTVTSCDVGGQALTLVQTLLEALGINRSTQLQRVGQNTGAATVTVNLSAATANTVASSSSISANNVDQSTPIVSGHNGTNGGNNVSPTVTITTATEELLVDCLSEGAGGVDTAGTNQTKRFESNPQGNGNSSLSTKDGINGGTMSWTIASSDDWALCAFAWAPVAASSTGPTIGSYRSTNPLILRNPLFSLMASYQGPTPIVVPVPSKEASDRSPYFAPGGRRTPKYLQITTLQGPTPIVVLVPSHEASDRSPYFAPGGRVNPKYLLMVTAQGQTPTVVASVVRVFFRKTLSLVGTRTGSRQSHNT